MDHHVAIFQPIWICDVNGRTGGKPLRLPRLGCFDFWRSETGADRSTLLGSGLCLSKYTFSACVASPGDPFDDCFGGTDTQRRPYLPRRPPGGDAPAGTKPRREQISNEESGAPVPPIQTLERSAATGRPRVMLPGRRGAGLGGSAICRRDIQSYSPAPTGGILKRLRNCCESCLSSKAAAKTILRLLAGGRGALRLEGLAF